MGSEPKLDVFAMRDADNVVSPLLYSNTSPINRMLTSVPDVFLPSIPSLHVYAERGAVPSLHIA